jgi:hypothetical protein
MAISYVDVVRNLVENTDEGRMQAVWRGIPVARILEDPTAGQLVELRSSQFPLPVTPGAEASLGNGFKLFGSAGSSVTVSADVHPAVTLATANTDNHAIVLAGSVPAFRLAHGRGDFAFECRLRVNQTTGTYPGLFVGLIQSTTLTVTNPMLDNGTLADLNFVGFHRRENQATNFDTVYRADGVAHAVVQSDALFTPFTATGYIRLGLRYVAAERRLYYVANNRVLTTSYAVPSTAGNPFPNDVNLTPIVAVKNAGAVVSSVTVSRIEAAQAAMAL